MTSKKLLEELSDTAQNLDYSIEQVKKIGHGYKDNEYGPALSRIARIIAGRIMTGEKVSDNEIKKHIEYMDDYMDSLEPLYLPIESRKKKTTKVKSKRNPCKCK